METGFLRGSSGTLNRQGLLARAFLLFLKIGSEDAVPLSLFLGAGHQDGMCPTPCPRHVWAHTDTRRYERIPHLPPRCSENITSEGERGRATALAELSREEGKEKVGTQKAEVWPSDTSTSSENQRPRGGAGPPGAGADGGVGDGAADRSAPFLRRVVAF